MSPERLQGEAALDARPHLSLGLGVVDEYATTGRRAFIGEALPAVLERVLTARPPLPRSG